MFQSVLVRFQTIRTKVLQGCLGAIRAVCRTVMEQLTDGMSCGVSMSHREFWAAVDRETAISVFFQ